MEKLRCRKNNTKRVDEEEVVSELRLSDDDHLIVDARGVLKC